MKPIKLIDYNVDGLPDKLDLKDLPWFLKPIVWIYQLIKNTTIVQINDNVDILEKSKNIGKYIVDADIIVVQEDFNYHNELMESLNNYGCGTQRNGFNISKLFSSIKWFPIPRFKSDGVNIIYNKNRVKVNKEDIVRWKKSHGYIGHANDKLACKGFRYYNVTIDNESDLDIYIVHMDADFYQPGSDVSKDVEARTVQLKQLTKYILKKGINNPTIIVGDTNCTTKYSWDIQNIKNNLLNVIPGIREVVPTNFSDVDRIFYVGDLQFDECYYDVMMNESDHKPLVSIIR